MRTARQRAAWLAMAAALCLAACGGGDETGPVIDAVTPSGASGGAAIEISGDRFCGDGPEVANEDGSCVTPPQGFVSFGQGEDATRALGITGWRHQQISLTVPDVPPGATVVVVTVDGVPSNAVSFEVQ